MSVSRGWVRVFYSSLRVCLSEIDSQIASGAISADSLGKTLAELESMKRALEREETSLGSEP
jgi:hypothetical protein